MEREYVWQYLLRSNGRPFGSPRRATTSDIEARVRRLPRLVAYNTETGEVVYTFEAQHLSATEGCNGTGCEVA